MVGFRPRHTTVHRNGSGELGGDASLVESVGDAGIVCVDSAVGGLRAVVEIEENPVEEGDGVGIDAERAYLFDRNDGTMVTHDADLGSRRGRRLTS